MIRFWHKFNQVVRSNICKGVDTMCNLSQGIVDRVTAEVTAKNLIDFIMNMYNNKFSLEQISLATKKSVDEVKRIIEEHEAVLV
jgi:hypothetical protein